MHQKIKKKEYGFRRHRTVLQKQPVTANKDEKAVFFVLYTVFFLLMCALIFAVFFRTEKTFIWERDGWCQHYKALVYYGGYLRQIAGSFFSGNGLILPEWSFSIGYGANQITTLHYYVIGDPLNLLAIFVPATQTAYLYGALILIRLYLAGMAFSGFCLYMGTTNRYALLSGALSYVFCGFALFASIRHPYFTNPMIYFPLLLLGTEKILRREKPYVFILSVFLAAVSNFYFLYMLAIMTALFAVVRLVFFDEPGDSGRISRILYGILRLAGYALLGLAMACFLFFPVIRVALMSSRTGAEGSFEWLYPAEYYQRFIGCFISYGSCSPWNYMGYSCLVLPAVFLLLRRARVNRTVTVLFCLLTAMLMIPAAGYALNGFAYVSNRWNWAYAFLVSYILVTMWPEFLNMNRKDGAMLAVCLTVYALLCLFNIYSRRPGVYLSLILALICVLVLPLIRDLLPPITVKRVAQSGMVAVTLTAIVLNAFFAYAPSKGNYVSEFIDYRDAQNLLSPADTAVQKAAGEQTEFFRYSGSSKAIDKNSTLISGLSDTQFYWSLGSSRTADAFHQWAISGGKSSEYNYYGMDRRTFANALACTRYYVTYGNDRIVPYGYTEKYKEGEYNVFENTLALPFGYTFDSYITEEVYDQLSPLERQEALLQSVLLEDSSSADGCAENVFTLSGQEIPYTIGACSSGIQKKSDSFVVTKENATMTLNFSGQTDCETYFYIDGFEFSPASGGTEDLIACSLALRAKDTEGKYSYQQYTHNLEKSIYFSGVRRYMVNLGYRQAACQAVRITFPSCGTYSFATLKILCQPMETFTASVTALRQDSLQAVQFGTDSITGTIALNRRKILCLPMTYDQGWTAYVDGEKTELQCADTMYTALIVPEGEHQIRLVYYTPWRTVGSAVSLGGWLGFAGVVVFFYRRRRKEKINTSRQKNSEKKNLINCDKTRKKRLTNRTLSSIIISVVG